MIIMSLTTIKIKYGDDDSQEYEFSPKSSLSEIPPYLLEAAYLIKMNKDPDFDFDSIPENDPFTLHEVLYGGFDDVYQMKSEGAECYNIFLIPESISDFMEILSLDCPGPLMAGNTYSYIERKQSNLPVSFIHPMLKPILKNSYGLVLYRKQVVEIAGVIAGYSPEEQNELKIMLDNCKPGDLNSHRKKFLDGAAKNWVESSTANVIFKQIVYFSGYDYFDEWQASDHAMLTYRSAFMRYCYPEDYQTALDNIRHNQNKVKGTVIEAPGELNPLIGRLLKARLIGQKYQEVTSDLRYSYF